LCAAPQRVSVMKYREVGGMTYCGNGSADEPKEEKDEQPNELCGEGVHPTMLVSAVYGPGTNASEVKLGGHECLLYVHKCGPEYGDDRCYDQFNHDVVLMSLSEGLGACIVTINIP